MNTTDSVVSSRYPRTIELVDSWVSPGPQFFRLRPSSEPLTRALPLRTMSADDKDSILLLARSLPREQLLFLHHDITDPRAVDEWIAHIENGTTVTLLAEPDGTLEGFASLYLNPVRWLRKVGELAINIAPEWQSRGLGEGLCIELMALAAQLGLKRVTAQMIAEHKSARALFERLGFQIRTFLPKWVEDSEGEWRDLLMLSHEVES